MSGELKINKEYIILAGSDVVKIKVLDVTATSIRVHNLDDDFIKRYLLEDYKPRVIEEIGEHNHDIERAKILEAVNKPTLVETEYPTKALILGKSNDERLAEILAASKEEAPIVEKITPEKEIWKEITSLGHPYKISNKGRVKNHHNKILKPTIRGTQQYYLLVGMNKTQKCINVSTLLEEVFGLKKLA